MTLEEQKEKLNQEIALKRKEIAPDKMDISFNELMNMHQDGELIIKPEYQRFFRWTDEQKTALIESILLSIPIPPIFVAEDTETGKWELVDGLQRISTVTSFFGKLKEELEEDNKEFDDEIENEENNSIVNKWKLTSGRLLPDLEGLDIDSIPSNLILNIKRAACRVEILRGSNSNDMKYELFRRLNSGGSNLTAQEVRNAIYRGYNSNVNQLLIDSAQDQNFISLTNLNQSKKRELYDQELVLRFYAFSSNIGAINENTENYLNTYMDNSAHMDNFPAEAELAKFKAVFEILHKIGDDKIFRNSRGLFVPAWFEGISISIAKYLEQYKDQTSDVIIQKINNLKRDDAFKRLSGSASNSRSRNKKRLERALEIFKID